jgi:two-component system LytT family response regulator
VTLSALIVDDERLARRELAHLLAAHPEISVAGEAGSVEDAAALVRALDPDVVFLDIQMPKRSGFELLDAADVRRVVFVTAHDVHAIRAFDVNALDYLLKPVHPARLAVTVARLLGTSGPVTGAPALSVPDSAGASSLSGLSGPTGASGPSSVSGPASVSGAAGASRLDLTDHLFLADGKASRFVRVRAIVCIRGAGDYTELIIDDGKQLLSSCPLKDWEVRLPASFARVHRTAIVNLDQVERVERAGDDSYRVIVRGLADPVPMSRRHATRLRQLVP